MFNFSKKCEYCKGKASTREPTGNWTKVIEELFPHKEASLINRVYGEYGGLTSGNKGIKILTIAFHTDKCGVCDKCLIEAGSLILNDESLFNKCKACGTTTAHKEFCSLACKHSYQGQALLMKEEER